MKTKPRSGKESTSSAREGANNDPASHQTTKSSRHQPRKSLLKRKWPLEDISKVWLTMPPLAMALLAMLVVAAERSVCT